MNKQILQPEIAELVEKLKDKYALSGQDLSSYLEGLLYTEYTPYWDYIHLDTLLTLQKPKTAFPDELIFIIYHQITELYFRMILHEQKQICTDRAVDAAELKMRILRINRYFDALTQSFDIMSEGMEPEQFLQFRMALLPASGFQSAQYRIVEIYATPFIRLVDKDHRHQFDASSDIAEMFNYIYWQAGATELASGKKTLTLEMFEQKYNTSFLETAKDLQGKTLWDKYQQLGQKDAEIEQALQALDLNVNVNWPLAHYKTAVRYLARDPEDIAATGGTNWQKYLPPRFQKRIFYPELWTAEELDNWGKKWVYRNVFKSDEG
jgi:tryptophan 2,3-dioxygenase